MVRRKKKKVHKKFWTIFTYMVGVLAMIAVVQYLVKEEAGDAHFVNYKDFGIDMPENFSIHGIDVSSYQNAINWSKVKAMKSQNIKIGFAFIKATEGLSSVDAYFKTNWSNAHAAGITCGAYHFFIAGKSGILQAQNFIQTVHLNMGDLPPVVDIEQLYGIPTETMSAELQEYLTAIENHYHVKPIIYTYASFYNDYLKNKFDNYPLWVAHYYEEHKPRIRRRWNFWQHNENGRVAGIATATDFNVFNGDSAAFSALLLK